MTGCTAPWQWQTDPNFKADVSDFDDTISGWTIPFSRTETELDLFLKLFTKEIRQEVIQQTNTYADQTGDCSTRRWSNWRELDEQDLLKLIAVRMLMGVTRLPEMKQYWSRDPLLQYPIITRIMKQDRYFEILKYLHFSDNTQPNGDKLQKMGKIWDLCMQNFQNTLRAHKNISIDESLMLYKGRLSFKQYIPSKRSRFGVKIFSIVDETTGFVLFSMIYIGKDDRLLPDIRTFGYGGAIVLKLLEPYLNNGHHLYCDNYFTSPNLAKYLLERTTYICGTLRKNRKHTDPPPVRGPNKMKPGEIIVKSCQGVMTEYWRDKKVVSMISTSHDHSMVSVPQRYGGGVVMKPKTVLDYNKYARGTDYSDMMKKFYNIRRKSMKWYKTLFFYLVDLCIFNSFVIFKSIHPGTKTKFLSFRLNLIRQIIGSMQPTQAICAISSSGQPNRLTERHFLEYNPSTKSRQHGGRICHVCANKQQAGPPNTKKPRKETVFQCKQCKVALCPTACFELYHTVQNF